MSNTVCSVKKLLTSLLLFSCAVVAAAQSAEKNTEPAWVLAFSEFQQTGLSEENLALTKTVPELLQHHLNTPTGYAPSSNEKKQRALLNLTQKKLKLISERQELIVKKDKLFLSSDTPEAKTKEAKKLDEEIQKKDKELEKLAAEIKIENLRADSLKTIIPVKAWNEEKLFIQNEKKPLAVDLSDNKINALVTGIITDAAGYVVITVEVQTGLPQVSTITVSDAGRYEDIDTICETIAQSISAQIQALPKHVLYFDIQPKSAHIFVNETEVINSDAPLTVYANDITVFASAEGYKNAAKHCDLSSEYSKITITLDKLPTVAVSIPDTVSVYDKTKKVNPENNTEDNSQITIPKGKDILEFETADNVRTFVLVDPKNDNPVDAAKINLNTKPVKTTIEKQRSIMYWSLAGVYLSLPATFMLSGLKNDTINAFNSGRIDQNAANAQKIQNLNIGTNVMIGVTSALAVNYLVQVIIYLIKSDSTLPRQAR